MTINQRITQREALRHAYHCVIDRLITMRMQFAEHITDHRCGLARFGGRIKFELIHCVQNAALHRFLAIADIGQCPAFDYRDCVIEVSALGEGGEGQGFAAVISGGFEESGLVGHVFVAISKFVHFLQKTRS